MELKTQDDFKTRNDFVDYLHEQCDIGLTRELIYGRICRDWNPFSAITTPRVNKPGRNHPYKRQFAQEQARKWQEKNSND